jgi:hypothetical protein
VFFWQALVFIQIKRNLSEKPFIKTVL